jgi:DNA repair exonuclease SbcCD ATPase subunit
MSNLDTFFMKHLFITFSAFLLLASCGGNEAELTAQLESLKQENAELKIETEQLDEKEALLTEYSQFIMDIQNNLNSIRDKENTVLVPQSSEGIQQSAESIKSDLQQLGALLAENKRKIASMNSKLKNSNGQLNGLEEVIRNLTKQAEEREVKILGMKSELSDMGVAFDELMAAYENNLAVIANKNERIEEQEMALHTAYYAYGSKSELKENKVITSEGGVIGLGKTKKLRDDFNKKYFTEINTKEVKEIVLGVSKADIITTHPAGSYELVENEKVEKIIILNPDKFWSVSKYLVIVTK